MWPTVGQKSKNQPEMTKNYVCRTPYLSKHTSYDCVFCCTSLKWWHLQMLFSFFQNFGFLSCYNEMGWGGGGWKGKELSKMTKQICLTLYLRNCTSYDCGFWYTCVKWWYLQQFFFIFSEVWFFRFYKVPQ